jgi:hypothetical protein
MWLAMQYTSSVPGAMYAQASALTRGDGRCPHQGLSPGPPEDLSEFLERILDSENEGGVRCGDAGRRAWSNEPMPMPSVARVIEEGSLLGPYAAVAVPAISRQTWHRCARSWR